MKKSLYLFLLLPLFFGLYSCSDDDTTTNNPTPSANYFPFKVGNYWIYENRELDSNGIASEVVDGYDSTIVVETGVYYGKTGYKAVTYSFDTDNEMIGVDTAYYSADGSKLYVYTNDSFLPIDVIELTLGWLKVSDLEVTTPWTLIDSTINNVPLAMPGINSAKLNFKVTASNGALATITTAGKTFADCKHSILNMKPKMILSIDTLGVTGTVNIEYDFVNRIYFANQFGPIKLITEPQAKPSITSPDINPFLFGAIKILLEQQLSGQIPSIPGSQSILIRYKVN